MNTVPKTLGEVMDKDLAGFQQVEAHYLQLSHGLMGFFPALISETGEIVICLDRELLVKVMEKLPKRRSRIDKLQILANIPGQFGFEVGNPNGKDTQSLHILTAEEFEQRVQQDKKPFKWAPGLVGDDMTEEEFRETLEMAMRKCQ